MPVAVEEEANPEAGVGGVIPNQIGFRLNYTLNGVT